MACCLQPVPFLMLRMTGYGISIAGLLLTFASTASAQDPSDVQSRLNDLQKKQDEMFNQLESEQRKVQTFFDDRLYLGGFFESALTGIWGGETTTQFSVTPQSFALNLAADFNDSLRFNSQVLITLTNTLQNPDNDSNAPSVGLSATRQFGNTTTLSSISQAYIEYGSTPEFTLQAGRGYVPFGIAFQLRDLVLFRRRGGPQMINTNSPENIVTAAGSWSGVHFGGTSRLKERQWGYDLYSLTPATDPATLGGGARVWTDAISPFTIGFSTQVAKRHGFTYEAIGADLKVRVGRAGADAEYVANYTASGIGVSRSYYVEPYCTFFNDKWLIYGVADYLGNPLGQTISSAVILSDPFEKWEFGGGINWLPYTFTRFRVGLLYNDYEGSTAEGGGINRNYLSLDLSAGVEF
jgi:hypothetical protein